MTDGQKEQPQPSSEIILYQTEDGRNRIEVRLENETVWLTQQLMAELFQTTIPNISMHIRNIYADRELTSEATVNDFLTVRREGTRDVQRRIEFYNLDIIISVGYRVKSAVATRFRQWATERLREYIVKGFTLDDERLKVALFCSVKCPEKLILDTYDLCQCLREKGVTVISGFHSPVVLAFHKNQES